VRYVDSLPRPVRTIENVWIPLSDGSRMAARMWRPEDAERHRVPAIVEYIPYRKRDITRRRDEVNHPYLAGHGYACIRVDMRGSGDSDGVLCDQYLEQEQSDGVEAIQWAAGQPWCDGNVGMFGISWGGFNALQIAARRPAALKALIASCATDDLYADNMHYMGGCLLADNLSEATTMFAFNSTPPDPDIVGPRWREMWHERLQHSGHWLDIWLRHQRRDAYWKRGSVCEDYAAIRCPVMAVSGWADGYTNAVFRLLSDLQVPRMGLVGPWGHRYPHLGIPGPAIGFLQEALRWFDHWLKGRDTGITQEPALRVWMQDSVPPTSRYTHRPGRWVAEPSWPSPHLAAVELALSPGRILWDGVTTQDRDDAARGGAEPLTLQSPLTVGLFAGKWCSYAATPDLPHDQRQEDGGALVFESAPLATTVEILGEPVAELEVAVNRPVAQIAARLSDVLPDGKATRVSFGLLNLTHRDSHEHPEPLQPGRRYRVRLALNHIAQRFPPGHRIRLSLSTSYWPLAWPAPEPFRLEVYPASSTLRLPLRPTGERDRAPTLFGPPEGGVRVEHTQLTPEHHNWIVTRDLAEDSSVLEVIDDRGTWHIENTGTDVLWKTREQYRCRADEYASLVGETRTERGFRRDGWDVRVVTRTTLCSTPTSFVLTAELDAYEDDERVFSKTWHETIARDLL
jgi:putative CocE/NonD family hydrolase